MKKIRLRNVFIYGLACAAGALLLHTSQNVQKAEAELAEIRLNVEREQDTIRVLKTEWAYLNNPERLETLAKQYLGLVPPSPDTIKTKSSDLPSPIEPVPDPEIDPEITAQPVSLKIPQASPPKKISPQKSIPQKNPPKEKDFETLLRQVAEEEIQ